ncbi:hypothetical protein LAZ67_18000857 [Cordylochernes scorpioides]|uniref:Transposable element Tc1 transposase n=1 Tax=Cordylochernes scorpioides TaxID=51811 RepID=A0ABY6LHT4_9ARAC|nr:hypothetical protein LAZ67_18000857 [Cordylochernes scorpioides]
MFWYYNICNGNAQERIDTIALKVEQKLNLAEEGWRLSQQIQSNVQSGVVNLRRKGHPYGQGTSVGRYCDQGEWTDLICSMDKTPPPQLAGIVIRGLIPGHLFASSTFAGQFAVSSSGHLLLEVVSGHRTISRRLVANGLHSCRPLRRLPLTPPNRRQRLEWCRARSTWMTEWHRVVFSDESRFCLSSDSRRVRVWRRRGERSNPSAIVERPTVRQRGIMVWGAIAYDSRSPLLRIQGTMTAQRYVDNVLRPVTLPYLQGVSNALYQQDNARPHTARISQQALQDVQMLPWPPYSPDLSPIEHVWDIIGRRLHALPQPRSEDELYELSGERSRADVTSLEAKEQLIRTRCYLLIGRRFPLVLVTPGLGQEASCLLDFIYCRGYQTTSGLCPEVLDISQTFITSGHSTRPVLSGNCLMEIDSRVGRNQTTVMRICDRWMQEEPQTSPPPMMKEGCGRQNGMKLSLLTSNASVCNTTMVGFESGDTVERGCYTAALCTATLVLHRVLCQRYISEVLEPVVLPYLQGLPTAIFQQDNARPHVTRIVQKFFVNRQIELLPWPARSPDLSPIENMWSMVAQRLTQIRSLAATPD